MSRNKLIVSVLLLMVCFPYPGITNPVMIADIISISEFSTDGDWIELYVTTGLIDINSFSVNGVPVTINRQAYPFNAEYHEAYIKLDQSNTSGFDLTEEYGSIVFPDLDEIRYGLWGPIPSPLHHESVANCYPADYTFSPYYFGFAANPTPGYSNNMLPPEYGGRDICINEIFADSPDIDDSFIELYNKGETPIDIGGWNIVSRVRYTIPGNTVIGPGSFWVLNESEYPEGFQVPLSEGSICLQTNNNIMVERVGWLERILQNYSMIRFPDGNALDFQSYNAIDFRQSAPTPNAPNSALFEIESIHVSQDTAFVTPDSTYQLYCYATDSNSDTFRVQPTWNFHGDFATVDDSGLMTVTSYGNGQIISEFEGFTAYCHIAGFLTGALLNDTVLTAESSPYWINNVSVPNDITLTIEPGVTLMLYDQNGYINIYGRILACGNPENPIVFKQTTDQGGLRFKYIFSHDNVLEYCILQNLNSAIEIDDARVRISYCTFQNNNTSISINRGRSTLISTIDIDHCVITGGTGIIFRPDYRANIQNNLFKDLICAVDFSYYHFSTEESGPNFTNNCILQCNIGLLLRPNYGFYNIERNNIWLTTTPYSDVSSNLGVITTTNCNGAPCDAYYNIAADPLFVNPENGDFRLCAGSPCINAGDPSLLDEDGSISDIGCISGVTVIDGIASKEQPSEFALNQNSPNPFNASTVISYAIPSDGRVRLIVYNAAGQKVATLVDEHMSAGTHSVVFDGAGLSSGLYFTRLEAAGKVGTKKMMLVK